MKKWILAIVGVLAIVFFTAFKKAEEISDDVFDLLGISKEEAHVLMKENLLYVSLSTPSAAKLKAISPGRRAAMVTEIGAYMKEYFKSKEVEDAYKDYRQSIMPGRQEQVDVQARIDEIKNEITRTEADKRTASADMKALYDETLTKLKEQLLIYQDPSHPDHAVYTGKITYTPEQQQELDREMIRFNQEHPESLRQYLKLRLREFLDLTADIDFNARLISRNGRMRFEKPEYEARDYNWKKCFRAGKETIDAARQFAQQWIKEL